jgi:hypothetical protein
MDMLDGDPEILTDSSSGFCHLQGQATQHHGCGHPSIPGGPTNVSVPLDQLERHGDC